MVIYAFMSNVYRTHAHAHTPEGEVMMVTETHVTAIRVEWRVMEERVRLVNPQWNSAARGGGGGGAWLLVPNVGVAVGMCIIILSCIPRVMQGMSTWWHGSFGFKTQHTYIYTCMNACIHICIHGYVYPSMHLLNAPQPIHRSIPQHMSLLFVIYSSSPALEQGSCWM